MTGVVAPDQVITNAGAHPDDELVLTKPLGAGTVSTAVKRGIEGAPIGEAVEVMTTLNRDAAAAARDAGAHAMTDVTGFGLLGHLHELASASGLAAELEADSVPAIEGVLELLSDPDESAIAGGTRRNRAHAEAFTSFAEDVPEARRWLVSDAMTSGGLLVAVAPEAARERPRRQDRPARRRIPGGYPGSVSASGSPIATPPITPTTSAIHADVGTTSGISATATAIASAPSRSPSTSSPRRSASRSGIAHAITSASAPPLAPSATGTV